MKKVYHIITNISFILTEAILIFIINALLFGCMYINGGTEATFSEWFQNRIYILMLLPSAMAIYSVLIYFAIKKNKVGYIGLVTSGIISIIISIPVLSFCLPGPFIPSAFVPFDERTLLNRFREIICIISYLILLILNFISAVLAIRARDNVHRD